ncbi:MAG: hypothetical protein ACLGIK_16355 [Gemmatimonadota bacterium]
MPSIPRDDEGGVSPAGETPPSSGEPVEPTLAALVASLTRRAPDAVLALMAAVGIAGSVAVALLPPAWRDMLPAFLLLAAAGSWGMAERERDAHGTRATAFAVVRALAVLAGTAAAALLLLSFFGVALGTWIS